MFSFRPEGLFLENAKVPAHSVALSAFERFHDTCRLVRMNLPLMSGLAIWYSPKSACSEGRYTPTKG